MGSLGAEDVRRSCTATTRRTSSERVATSQTFVGESRTRSTRSLNTHQKADAFVYLFIPPRAPHMDGLWEAGVKTAKHLLLRAVGNARLTAEELQIVLVGVKAVLNSRPLGALSQDPSDGEALTPGHLLTGGPLIAPPAPRTPDQQGLTCLRRWRLVSSIKQMFWQRWSREYVLGLQARSKWQHQGTTSGRESWS
ncbi:uncharacterized protein Pur-alpha isoform X3 [Drosophila bipectinata]|uniref:uncharacterized protein Pur-alpha isoform X3 n=1 Tax=Drosophila bipectinata TaxID=42026 RepID=UPI0038B30F6C